MTRKYRCIKIVIRTSIAEAIEKKYNMSFEDAAFEIVNETVCMRVYNKCAKCNSEIFLFILKKDWKEADAMRNTNKAVCNTCNPASNWRRA